MRAHRSLLAAALVGASALAGCVGDPPEGLECEATAEGNLLTWESAENATGYNVYRAENGTDARPELVGSTTETEFLDANVTDGRTYTYGVTVVRAEGESAPETCTLTAIPVFPNLLAGAAALVGGVGAYALFRRRR